MRASSFWLRQRGAAAGVHRDLDAWIAIVAPDRSRDLSGYLAVRYSYPAGSSTFSVTLSMAAPTPSPASVKP